MKSFATPQSGVEHSALSTSLAGVSLVNYKHGSVCQSCLPYQFLFELVVAKRVEHPLGLLIQLSLDHSRDFKAGNNHSLVILSEKSNCFPVEIGNFVSDSLKHLLFDFSRLFIRTLK